MLWSWIKKSEWICDPWPPSDFNQKQQAEDPQSLSFDWGDRSWRDNNWCYIKCDGPWLCDTPWWWSYHLSLHRFINQFNVCSLLHKSLVTDPAQWAPDCHQVMSSSCLAHSNLGSCLLNRNSDTSLSSLQMSPLLVTGLWMLAVACVEASPASDTWTQTSLATKHSPQVSISCVPIFIINSVSSDESWLVCAVSGSCIWILSCILMMCSKKRTGRTKYWSIFNNKKALSLNLRPDRFRDKTFTRIHTQAWFRVYIAEH